VGWLTSDGASVNRTTIKELEHRFRDSDPDWTAEEHDILCMEHSLHLAAKHFVEAVAPASPKSLRKKIEAALSRARELGALDLDELDKALSQFNLDALDDMNEEDDFTPGDSLGKALALVKQIRASPQAKTFFKSSCGQVEIKPLELILWIRTRWGSLYKFLDRTILMRKGLEQFILLADASDKVPDLSKNRCYSDFQLTKRDWDKLQVLHEVLREPANVQQTFSSERAPTVWRIIPSLEFLIKRWESMAAQPRFESVSDPIKNGIENLKKWYRRVENTSSAYFICLDLLTNQIVVLDPNVKDLYCRARWEPEQFELGMERLNEVFDQYYIARATIQDTAHENVMGNS
ncbi:hypothetical protein H0H92_010774, partial [Tricholoma furcatifolium]